MHTLHIRPHDEELQETSGVFRFWAVLIDGAERWPYARPFEAGAARIKLEECIACGGCGADSTLVRRHNNVVLWLSDVNHPCGLESLDDGEILDFDISQYQAALGSGDPQLLPAIRGSDVAPVLADYRFQYLDGTEYSYTGASSYPSQNELEELISRLAHAQDLTIVEQPPTFHDVHYWSQAGEQERVFRWGQMLSGEFVCQFSAFPHMPVWLASRAIDEVLAGQR